MKQEGLVMLASANGMPIHNDFIQPRDDGMRKNSHG